MIQIIGLFWTISVNCDDPTRCDDISLVMSMKLSDKMHKHIAQFSSGQIVVRNKDKYNKYIIPISADAKKTILTVPVGWQITQKIKGEMVRFILPETNIDTYFKINRKKQIPNEINLYLGLLKLDDLTEQYNTLSDETKSHINTLVKKYAYGKIYSQILLYALTKVFFTDPSFKADIENPTDDVYAFQSKSSDTHIFFLILEAIVSKKEFSELKRLVYNLDFRYRIFEKYPQILIDVTTSVENSNLVYGNKENYISKRSAELATARAISEMNKTASVNNDFCQTCNTLVLLTNTYDEKNHVSEKSELFDWYLEE